MAKVEIYTKMDCVYCDRARALLNSKAVEFEEIDTTMSSEARKVMLQRAPDHTTRPSIFINGQHIGGSSELAALDRNGQLDALLAA